MKYPITEESMKQAREYAEKAGGYTHLHEGFEDTTQSQQYKRWVTGGFAQNIVKNYCISNDILCIEDSTTYKDNDRFDLKIQGFKFDIKATNTNIQCQVNKTSMIKATKGETHAFFFMRIDKDLKWYEPIGFCTSKYYGDNASHISKGDLIPKTSFVNKFNTTYVMDEDKIQYSGIESLAKLKHRRNNAIIQSTL